MIITGVIIITATIAYPIIPEPPILVNPIMEYSVWALVERQVSMTIILMMSAMMLTILLWVGMGLISGCENYEILSLSLSKGGGGPDIAQ